MVVSLRVENPYELWLKFERVTKIIILQPPYNILKNSFYFGDSWTQGDKKGIKLSKFLGIGEVLRMAGTLYWFRSNQCTIHVAHF